MIELKRHLRYAIIRLNDPAKRNALSIAVFEAIDDAVAQVARDDAMQALLLTASGSAFCAGFDLAAAIEEPELISTFIHRLSALNRKLRRMPQVVIAAVRGAAVAGGCAMVSACDLVIAAPDAKFGYPVHAIGISPAVTIPTLQQAIGPSQARSLLMSGEIISAKRAHALGLITHLASSTEALQEEAHDLAFAFASKPPRALRITKAWLNELDGSLNDESFDHPATASAEAAAMPEAEHMLRRYWNERRTGHSAQENMA